MQRFTRTWLGHGAAMIMGLALAVPAMAAYPDKPVRMVVGFSPGSSTDVAARALAQELSQRLGQPFVVENRAGASSNIAARAVAAAPPDGYTVFFGTIANTINVSLQPAVSVNLLDDMEAVAMVGSVPNLLVTHPSLQVKTLDALIAKAKAEPGKISYGSAGIGTAPHLSGELFGNMAGVQLLHVPYKGSSAAVADLLAGQVQLMFGPASTVLPHIRSGALDALAATSLSRTPSAPDLPTIDEPGLAGFETSVWFGLNVPKGTPTDVIDTLQRAVREAQREAPLREQFAAQGIDIVEAGPAEYRDYLQRETAKWARLVQDAAIPKP